MTKQKKPSIQFTGAAVKHVKFLRKHFGGIGQGAVMTLALNARYKNAKQ
jgi:hypothetical protein